MHSFWKAVTLKFRPDEIPVGMHVTEATAPLYFLGTSDPLFSGSSTEQMDNTLNPQCAGITATSAAAICHCVWVGSLA